MPQVNGQPGKMDWASYAARRRLDVSKWIESKGFKSYSELSKWLDAKGVEAPDRSLVTGAFKKKKAPAVSEAVAVESKPEAPKKKRGARRKLDTE